VELLPCAIPYRYKLTLEDTGRRDGPSERPSRSVTSETFTASDMLGPASHLDFTGLWSAWRAAMEG
jgi:hypothetical protein